MELSIIFVNWNSVNYLRDCIPSILEHTRGIEYEIIVVDNASPEGGVEALKEEFPDIVLIKSSENLGFAGANNLGFRKSKGEYVLFLNPDTKLINPAIDIMLRGLQSLPGAGIVGCKLLNADGSVQTSCIMKFPGILNQVIQYEGMRLRWPSFPLWNIGPLFSASKEPARVEVITGACMMMRREVFAQVGMFSEEYFMYAEDVDLCWKTTLAGFPNYHLGEGNIIHYGGVSSPRDWQVVAKIKAELRLCAKFHGKFYAFFFRTALVMNAVIRLSVAAILYSFKRVIGSREASNKTLKKYQATLGTLLTPSGSNLHPPNARSTNTLQVAKNERPAH